MYIYAPKSSHRVATLLVALFAVLTGTGILWSRMILFLNPLGHFLALCSLIVAVQIAGRYLCRRYIYHLEPCGDGVDLIVVEKRGEKVKVVCRVGVSQITDVIREAPECRKELRRRYRSVRRYDYAPDVGIANAVYLFVDDGGENYAVRFVPDKQMETMIRDLVASERGETCVSSAE